MFDNFNVFMHICAGLLTNSVSESGLSNFGVAYFSIAYFVNIKIMSTLGSVLLLWIKQ